MYKPFPVFAISGFCGIEWTGDPCGRLTQLTWSVLQSCYRVSFEGKHAPREPILLIFCFATLLRRVTTVVTFANTPQCRRYFVNMPVAKVCENGDINSKYRKLSSSFNSYEEGSRLLPARAHFGPRSPEVVRPCYYVLQILGMWKPRDGKFEFIWRLYRAFVCVLWFGCLAAIMCLDFVHHGFDKEEFRFGEIMNSVPTCLNLLCPFIFTVYYLKQGQFVELIFTVQNVSSDWHQKLRRIARWYTFMSVFLWAFGAVFFTVHWIPFLSKPWHYILYIPSVVYSTGWWGTWLSIYGFVCHVHSLQIDTVVDDMKSNETRPVAIMQKFSQLQNSLERTQTDFNIIISFALAYHAADIIIFSFAYFNSSFGSTYELWQYVGGVLFDLISIIVKLYPPAIVAAAAHRIVLQAARRYQLQVTPLSTELPLEDMQLFQYIALCESDMGLKILGLRITVERAMKIFMTIVTAAVSFVAFVVPRLK